MAKKIEIQYLTVEQVIALLKTHQGGKQQNEFAAELGISPQMMSEVYKGTRNPGAGVLAYLSEVKGVELERVTMYKMVPRGGK